MVSALKVKVKIMLRMDKNQVVYQPTFVASFKLNRTINFLKFCSCCHDQWTDFFQREAP